MKRPLMVALMVAVIEMGQAAPQPVSGDNRIQSIVYAPDQTVTLQAAIGYALVVELSEEDRIENMVLGDSGAWQVSANKRGDHLVIKPVTGASATDLVVTTETRRYVFLLQPSATSDSTPFVVRFEYPQVAATQESVAAATIVATFRMRGDKALYPLSISDDGKDTAMTWGHDTPLPAVFAVDAQGAEAIVNGRMVDGTYIVQGVAARYVFRLGKAQATAIRHIIKARR